MESEHPEAKAVLKTKGRVWIWTILECPYCGEEHFHIGGFIGSEDPKLLIGKDILARCVDENGYKRRYKIVEE